MKWLWSQIRTSARLAADDTVEVQGARVMTGLQVNAIALVIAAWATHKVGAYWTVVAYPVLMAATYAFYLIRRLRGWNRLWRATSQPHEVAGENRQDLNLHLETTGHVALMYHVLFDVECRVCDPLGQEYVMTEHGIQFFRGRFYANYPYGFDQAPAVVPGRYTVTWVQAKPPGSGKWRVMHSARVDVPALNPAAA